MLMLMVLLGCGPSAEEIAQATADEQERREAKATADATAAAELENTGSLWAEIAAGKVEEGTTTRATYEGFCGECHGKYAQGGTAGSIRPALQRLNEEQLLAAMFADAHPEAVRSRVPKRSEFERSGPLIARYLKEASVGWSP